MTDLKNIRPEDFVEHAASLRQFARSLLRCSSAADDAVQETWIRVSSRPRPAPARLGSWLRTSLRNIVVSQARSESARARREAENPTEQESSSTLDLLARRETLDTVIRAIGRLSDAHQAVVFLRFFDGCKPREISAQLGIPVSVVHHRLRQALTELRKLLDDMSRDRDWRAGLAAAFGLPGPADPIWTQPIEGVNPTMSVSTQLTIAAGTLAAIAIPATIYLSGETTDPAPGSATVASSEQSETIRSANDPSTPAGDRVAVDPSEPDSDPLAQLEPHLFTLEFHSTTSRDVAARGTPIVAGPDAHVLNVVGTTDRDGRFTMTWRASVREMDIVVQDAGPSGVLRRLHVTSGTPQHVALRPLADPMIDVFNPSIPRAMRERADLVRFVSPAPHEYVPEEIPEEEEFGVMEIDEAPEPDHGRVAIEARTVGGRPAAEAWVLVQGAQGRSWRRTDENGQLMLDVVEGTYDVRVGGGDHGRATRSFDVRAGSETAWVARLDRGAELLGRLLDGDGQPLANWTVRASSATADSAWADLTTTDADGNYAIPNVPDRQHRIEAFPPSRRGFAGSWSMKTYESWPNRLAETVVARASSHGAIELSVVPPTPEQILFGTRVRVTSIQLGRAFETSMGVEPDVNVGELPPGRYRVEIGGPYTQWRVVGECQVQADQTTKLPAVTLDARGRVALVEDRLAWLGRIRDDLVTRIVADAFAAAGPLPPSSVALVFDDFGESEETTEELVEETVEPSGSFKGVVAQLDDVTNGVIESSTEEMADAVFETQQTTHFQLPPGRYLAVLSTGEIVEWNMAAGQNVDLADVLKR